MKLIQNYWREILSAFLLTILFSTMTFYSVVAEHNVYDEFDQEQIEWQIDSSLSLSSQFQDHSKDLLIVDIETWIIVDSYIEVINNETGEVSLWDHLAWVHRDSNLFNFNTSSFEIKYVTHEREIEYQLADNPGTYMMKSDQMVGTEVDASNLLPVLHDAFAADIVELPNPVNISAEEIKERRYELPPETYFWEINHYYTDGTVMEFKILDDIMFLRYYHLDFLKITESGYQGRSTTDTSLLPTYVMEVDQNSVLPSYTASINQILNQYYEGV